VVTPVELMLKVSKPVYLAPKVLLAIRASAVVTSVSVPVPALTEPVPRSTLPVVIESLPEDPVTTVVAVTHRSRNSASVVRCV